ncbi:hypothetical protein KIPB_005393 [Kipferlia bialata]|uniref:Uncharacterized protein n=1 Tax=Kipferlia bialata TaxID=797122 RepID=A0A9K3GI45_9EUKA|nr:hypothetical protein KIPB_005393 [Kipferlia bialata]|eukprot:g5393.t1
MSPEETAQVVELSRPQLEDILPSILSAPYSVMASLQSLLLRWKEEVKQKRALDLFAHGVSANWTGSEEKLCDVYRSLLYLPLLEELIALASVLKLKYFVARLRDLKEDVRK